MCKDICRQSFGSTSQWIGEICVLVFIPFQKISLQSMPAFPVLQFGFKEMRCSSGTFSSCGFIFFFNLVWPGILWTLWVRLCKCLFSPHGFIHDYIAEAFGSSLLSILPHELFSQKVEFLNNFLLDLQSCLAYCGVIVQLLLGQWKLSICRPSPSAQALI